MSATPMVATAVASIWVVCGLGRVRCDIRLWITMAVPPDEGELAGTARSSGVSWKGKAVLRIQTRL